MTEESEEFKKQIKAMENAGYTRLSEDDGNQLDQLHQAALRALPRANRENNPEIHKLLTYSESDDGERVVIVVAFETSDYFADQVFAAIRPLEAEIDAINADPNKDLQG